MKCVALVPIKTTNRRLPGKNTRCFTNGEPLCRYILKTLCGTKYLDGIYVYSSDESLISYLPEGVTFLKRPESLDKDTTSMNEILKCFIDSVDSDVYLLTHATAPFITKESLEKGISAVISGDYDSSFSVEKCQNFYWKNGEPFNYDPENIPRTQDLEPLYEETCGFYCFRKEVIAG
ncbi:MAG: hypothetical protein J5494_00785, partial [Candidatus Methanomethylophilaceae archaeon]|nr:hypothetical protein [Candidatus Methanomethylophilaceae archaeon]